MSGTCAADRKCRTRDHVIACLSTNYVERLIYEAGYTADRVEHDYGYDLNLNTFDQDGYIENGQVYIQLKASDKPRYLQNGELSFTIDRKDYNLWHEEPMPVFLVVYDATKRCAYWLYFQYYFAHVAKRKPKAAAKKLTVRIPTRQRIRKGTILYMRRCKETAVGQAQGAITHDG